MSYEQQVFTEMLSKDQIQCEMIEKLKEENKLLNDQVDEMENIISRLRNPNNNNVVKLRLVK